MPSPAVSGKAGDLPQKTNTEETQLENQEPSGSNGYFVSFSHKSSSMVLKSSGYVLTTSDRECSSMEGPGSIFLGSLLS
jgi:hypothetical protein